MLEALPAVALLGKSLSPIKGDKQTGSRLGWDEPRADPEQQGATEGPRTHRPRPVSVRDTHSALPSCPSPPRGVPEASALPRETWAVLLGLLTLRGLGLVEDEQRTQRESDGGRSLSPEESRHASGPSSLPRQARGPGLQPHLPDARGTGTSV